MSSTNALAYLGLLLLQNGFLAGLALVAWRRQGITPQSAGLGRPSGRQIALGAGLGLMAALGSYWLGDVELWVCRLLLSPDALRRLQSLTDSAGAEHTFARLPAYCVPFFILLGTTIAPLCEELCFRGWIYTAFKKRLGVPAGIVASALLFAALHLSLLHVLPLFALGVAFAFAYERTGSLWVAVLMHAVNNGVAFVLLTRTLLH